MERQRLYIVHGMGNDAVGLVGSITAPVAKAGGNIVDLRQDVLHGLFTIFMVVDLTEGDLRIDDLKKMVKEISEDTGITLSVDKYLPVARAPEKKNMLMILIGTDKPGIISSISETLGKYGINIEFSQTIGREDVFLMELLTDNSRCTIPAGNLQESLRMHMAEVGISTIFQMEDVFNKKKRIILFDIASSFISSAQFDEIAKQTEIAEKEISATFDGNGADNLAKAASLLDGFPVDVLNGIAEGMIPAPGTVELIQTLKIMGYKIGLVSNAFSPLTDGIKKNIDIDYAMGMPLEINDDSKTVSGETISDEWAGRNIESIATKLAGSESVARDDITVISAGENRDAPGIRLKLDLGKLLDYYNKHVVSKENLIGILGSFGTLVK